MHYIGFCFVVIIKQFGSCFATSSKALPYKSLDFASQHPVKLCHTNHWILLRNIHQSSALRIKPTKKRSSKLGVFSYDFIHS